MVLTAWLLVNFGKCVEIASISKIVLFLDKSKLYPFLNIDFFLGNLQEQKAYKKAFVRKPL